jgi:pimeloyl-ACP methyl ester carboxylesterase
MTAPSTDASTENSLEGLANAIPDAATGSASTPTQRAFIRTLILSQTTKGYISLCRLIAGAQAPPYEEIKCPLLVIAGEEDKTSPLASCTHIKER